MKPKLHTTPIVALLAVLSWSTPARAVPFTNGSFETGPSIGGAFVNVPGGSTAILGWTVGGIAVDFCGPATWNISDGVRNIDLDGSSNSLQQNGSISQTFDTIAGQNYLVTFDFSGNPANLPLLKQMQVSAGATTEIFTYDIGAVVPPLLPLTIAYEIKEFTFAAIANSSTLTFTSLTPLSGIGTTGFGAIIDNVSVASSVPDGGTTATMLCMAMTSLALIRRKLS